MAVGICPRCDVLWTDTRLAKGIKAGNSPRLVCPDCKDKLARPSTKKSIRKK